MEPTIPKRPMVAADFDPDKCGGKEGVRREVLKLAQELSDIGVSIKIESALKLCGPELIPEIHDLGLPVFADPKLYGISSTLRNDARGLRAYEPEFLTVACAVGIEGMRGVQEEIGDTTKVLGVTVPTSFDEKDCENVHVSSVEDTVLRLADLAYEAGLRDLVLSPRELVIVRERCDTSDFTLYTPCIRPAWAKVEGDDQVRYMTPEQAIRAGADYLIVGRPVTQAKPNSQGRPKKPREAVIRILGEIHGELNAKAVIQ